ncbi:DUF6082 family protein [Streptomyces ortus]|uniref:DUF6082 family protein n=1 Tax=Streptomyces ortus TaxID=2867268 RepID=A0ABT3V017_9ACTN|nr:DUF6082 family protein [Streptomyces ortus]MCX4231736.1 DUF6082 family protein [Streptomyces ortus]
MDAVIEQMLRDASSERQAGEIHQVAAMIAAIGMRTDPTGADIDDLRRLFMAAHGGARDAWKARGRRFGLSASRFLTGLSQGIAEARRGSSSRGQVQRVGGQRRRDRDEYLTNLVTVHDMRLGLLSEAIDNPDFAATLDVYAVEVTPAKRKQFLFIEAVYRTYLLEWRIGAATRQELFGNLRILFVNPIFREYWEATRPHRASLAPGSAEAEIGRMGDALLMDLDEADTDDWWVVGEPPTD